MPSWISRKGRKGLRKEEEVERGNLWSFQQEEAESRGIVDCERSVKAACELLLLLSDHSQL